MTLKLIGCELLSRELCHAVMRSSHRVDIEFLPKALHEQGARAMRDAIQAAIDRASASNYDAIVLGYGLCGNGLAGIVARDKTVVIPRAHDCITLLMGSRREFDVYFDTHSGVYFRSSGWVERAPGMEHPGKAQPLTGYTLEELVNKFGEERGSFVFGELSRYQQQYHQITYIKTGIEPDDSFEQRAASEAEARGWEFEQMSGDLRLFERLLAGEWDPDEFLVVPPGWQTIACYDDRVIDVEKCAGE